VDSRGIASVGGLGTKFPETNNILGLKVFFNIKCINNTSILIKDVKLEFFITDHRIVITG